MFSVTSAADLLTTVLNLETEKDVYKSLTEGGTRAITGSESGTVDSQMCNILIAETGKLKEQILKFTENSSAKDNEIKQLRKRLRDIEREKVNAQNTLSNYQSEETRIKVNYKPGDLTSKATLRRFVDELTKECGELIGTWL